MLPRLVALYALGTRCGDLYGDPGGSTEELCRERLEVRDPLAQALGMKRCGSTDANRIAFNCHERGALEAGEARAIRVESLLSESIEERGGFCTASDRGSRRNCGL